MRSHSTLSLNLRILAAVLLGLGLSDRVFAQTSASWLSATSGNWTDATRWSTNPNYPNNGTPVGTTYDATVAATGSNYTVTLNSPVTVNSLTINSANATIAHTGGTFTGTIDMHDGAFNLNGGTIQNSTIISPVTSQAPGRVTVIGSSTFDNVIIQGTAFANGGTLTVLNGLNLAQANHGLWFQGTAASVDLPGNQTITGIGEIVFNSGPNSAAVVRATNGGILTIDSGITIRTAGGSFNTLGDAASGLVIKGTVNSSNSLKSITITGANWTNTGVIQQSNGGGINLMGTFTTTGLGDFRSPEGRIVINGTLTNTGSTLTMDATHGYLTLQTGTVVGGTIVSTAATPFRTNPGNNGNGTLDGVTLAGVMDMSIGKVQVLNGLTLSNGQIVMDASNLGVATLSFPGNQTLGGTGEVVFAGQTAIVRAESNGTLTIGPNVTIRTGGDTGTVGAAGHGVANQGIISAQTASKTLFVTGNTITNDGTMEARTNANLNINATTSFTNRGLLVAQSGGTVTLSGALVQDTSTTAETRVIGTLNAASVDVKTGSLTGSGTVGAPVTNRATVSPGLSPGVLTVGNFDQTATGVLSLEIGGTTRGTNHDALVTGTINLNGTVKVSLINGFSPSAGQSFDVLDWTGSFAGTPSFDFSAAALAGGLGWDTSLFSTTGTLQVVPVPEPGLLAPISFAAGVWAWRRSRQSRMAPSQTATAV